METPTSDKIDFLKDIQGNAHAYLTFTYPQVYTTLLGIWYSRHRDRDLRSWYVDERANPKLFYGLLAFAQPDIFKAIYARHERCLGILQLALKTLYCDPMGLDIANRALDEKLESNDDEKKSSAE